MSVKKTKSEDTRSMKNIRAEFSKHGLEVQNAEFRVMYDICYVTGSIGLTATATQFADARRIANTVREHCMQHRMIKDMVFHCSWRV